MTDRPLSPAGQVIKENPLIYVGLWSLALSQTRKNDADAKDLLQDTMGRVFEDEAAGKWIAGNADSVRAFCVRKLINLAGNYRDRRRRAVRKQAGADHVEPTNPDPDPERAASEKEEEIGRRKLIEEVKVDLRRKGEKGRIPLAMLEWGDQGVSAHPELADRIGCTVPDIRLAQRRLTNAVRRVRGEPEVEEEAS